MAGMGLEGAYGAQGTFEGLKDWMRGQRQKVVQGQQDTDRLREQRLKDEALATEAADRERLIARQRVADEADALERGQRTTVFTQGQADRARTDAARNTMIDNIKALDDPKITQLHKMFAIDAIQNGRDPERIIRDALEVKEKKLREIDTVNARGQHVTLFKPEDEVANQEYRAYDAPRLGSQGPQPSYQWVVPQGQTEAVYRVPQATDRQPTKPQKPPTMPAKQQESLINADTSEQVLMQLKPLYEGDETNADPAKRFLGARHFVGPYAGREKRTLQWAGQDKDDNFATFDAASARLENAIVQAITGAAVGKDEEKRIMREIPRPTDSDVQWKAHWEQSMRNIAYLRSAIHRQAALMGRPLGDDGEGFGAPVVLDPRGGGTPAKARFTIIDTK